MAIIESFTVSQWAKVRVFMSTMTVDEAKQFKNLSQRLAEFSPVKNRYGMALRRKSREVSPTILREAMKFCVKPLVIDPPPKVVEPEHSNIIGTVYNGETIQVSEEFTNAILENINSELIESSNTECYNDFASCYERNDDES